MELLLFKTLWGREGTPREAVEQAVKAGFHGVEAPAPEDAEERRVFADLLAERGMLYIAEISATGYANPEPGASVRRQLDAFERLLGRSLEMAPRLCTAMAGNDLWTFKENVEFLTKAGEIARNNWGMRVGFETHRGRSLYHPLVTRDLLMAVPELELTVDFSHWCVVTERLVMDHLPWVLELCAQRVLHIHARVGYDQGAQTPDPRAPEYAAAVEAHLRWWRALWEGQNKRKMPNVTMTPEFGPDGYLQMEPFTRKPAADLWEVNRWMGTRLKEEYADFTKRRRQAVE